MTTQPVLFPVLLVADTDPLVRAVAAYLARFKDATRVHTESDLRAFLAWCTERRLPPLSAQRVHIELYIRWMQEVRRFKPSTVSRRMSVVAGFYRTCVIDQVMPTSPADYVRRPNVPAESPTLGLSHLQFEAMLAAARDSANRFDFALVAMLGLLGLRIFEACGANIDDLGEEHGHRVLKVRGKGGKVVLTPLPPAVARAVERATDHRTDGPILLNRRGARMDRHAATRRLRRLAMAANVRLPRMHPHMLRHTFVTTMLDAGVDLRDVQIAARHADPRTTMRYDRARKNLDRHPNYILAAYMASGTQIIRCRREMADPLALRTLSRTLMVEVLRMTAVSATSARANLYRLIDQVNEESEPLTITGQRGNAVLIGEDDWRAIQESLFLAGVPNFAESIRQARSEGIEAGSDSLEW